MSGIAHISRYDSYKLASPPERESVEPPERTQTCKLCGDETHGATGAAGIFWPWLCQQCKDAEDAALWRSLTRQIV